MQECQGVQDPTFGDGSFPRNLSSKSFVYGSFLGQIIDNMALGPQARTSTKSAPINVRNHYEGPMPMTT